MLVLLLFDEIKYRISHGEISLISISSITRSFFSFSAAFCNLGIKFLYIASTFFGFFAILFCNLYSAHVSNPNNLDFSFLSKTASLRIGILSSTARLLKAFQTISLVFLTLQFSDIAFTSGYAIVIINFSSSFFKLLSSFLLKPLNSTSENLSSVLSFAIFSEKAIPSSISLLSISINLFLLSSDKP